MNIYLSPVRVDGSIVIKKFGDTIILNDETFDFSRLKDGESLPSDAITSCFFESNVYRENGDLNITIRMPIPENYSPEQAFPSPILNVIDGLVSLPKPL